MIVFLNGKFLDAKETKISVFDHGFLYGDGCFETLRTYDGKLFRIEEHIERLKKSAKSLKIDFSWENEEIIGWMKETLQKNGFAESRLRITITRGKNDFNFVGAEKPTILIVVSEFIPHPQEIYQKGVSVKTLEIERLLPQVKSLNLLPSILGQQIKRENNVFETLFINRVGKITEGTVSNFFIVKNNTLFTSPEKSVLSGITRDVVLELATELQIPVQEKFFSLQECFAADEAFLTSTVMDIAPVVQIEKKQISNGKVGTITQKLIDNFYHYIQKKND